MKRLTLSIIILLLLAILSASIVQLPIVKAYNYSLNYAPNCRQWFETVYEEEVTNYVVEYIAQQFAYYGYWQYYADYYIDAESGDYDNLYGIESNPNVENIAVFTKGHTYGQSCAGGTPHRAHMAHTPYSYVFDRDVSDWTQGKTQLAVIWHCGTAQAYTQYGSNYCNYCGDYYTFPMTYTKYNGMSIDGYDNPSTGAPYAFLGFYGYSQQFLSDWWLDGEWYYYPFVAYFYMMLVQNQFTINDAIDQACFESSGDWWPWHGISQYQYFDPDGQGGLDPAWTQMKILGNGDMHYPGYPW